MTKQEIITATRALVNELSTDVGAGLDDTGNLLGFIQEDESESSRALFCDDRDWASTLTLLRRIPYFRSTAEIEMAAINEVIPMARLTYRLARFCFALSLVGIGLASG